jgi:hypothetical protein
VRERGEHDCLAAEQPGANCRERQALLAVFVAAWRLPVLAHLAALCNVLHRMRQGMQARSVLREQYEYGKENRNETITGQMHG